MSDSDLRIYVHFVWTTKHRQPTISRELERIVHRVIRAEVNKLGCKVVAVNGTEDHVHLLVQFSAQVAVARFCNQLKGASARYINGKSTDETVFFQWQNGYGAFSVAENQIPIVAKYIDNQKEHHANNTLWCSLEPQPGADSAAHFTQSPHDPNPSS